MWIEFEPTSIAATRSGAAGAGADRRRVRRVRPPRIGTTSATARFDQIPAAAA
jgi:hypothetical protein